MQSSMHVCTCSFSEKEIYGRQEILKSFYEAKTLFIQWVFLSVCCCLATARSWTTTESVSWPPATTDVSTCFLFHVLNKLSVCTCIYILLGASQSSSFRVFVFIVFCESSWTWDLVYTRWVFNTEPFKFTTLLNPK